MSPLCETVGHQWNTDLEYVGFWDERSKNGPAYSITVSTRCRHCQTLLCGPTMCGGVLSKKSAYVYERTER